MRLEGVELCRLAVPLVTPYRLAFGPVERFDTIVVQLRDDAGGVGVGEATVLTGYTAETIDDAWRVAREFAATLGSFAKDFDARVATLGVRHPFTATAFGTAYEMLRGSPVLQVARRTRVPLLGLLNAEDAAAMAVEIERLLAAGFRTLKLKVGFDPVGDAARVRTAQRMVQGRARLRLDSNQGYTAQEGIAFVRALAPDDVELFEQPCAAGDWDAHLAVARAAAVPMMLDESIYGLEDIERAAELRAATYIKLKLMKLGTIDALRAAITRIHALGMRAVLGNGVACEISCWMEACVAAEMIDNAGEMNGFLKPHGGLFASPLPFADGAIVLEPGFAPRLDPDRLASYTVERAAFALGRAVHASAP